MERVNGLKLGEEHGRQGDGRRLVSLRVEPSKERMEFRLGPVGRRGLEYEAARSRVKDSVRLRLQVTWIGVCVQPIEDSPMQTSHELDAELRKLAWRRFVDEAIFS